MIARGVSSRQSGPTAAAISYGFTPDGANDVKTILVYDFGGGTFDASLITASGNWFTELGKVGSSQCRQFAHSDVLVRQQSD